MRARSLARRGSLLVPVILVITVLPSGRSVGHDHTYPALIAHAGDAQQLGRNWSVTWHSGSEDGHCGTLVGHGPPRFHKNPARFPVPETIRLEFAKEQAPESVSIGVARKLRARGHNTVIGKRRYPEYRIEPVTNEEGVVVGWVAAFDVFRARHFYMDVRASWPDVDGCGGRQEVNWTLHLEGV
jgi:hypothetical protein